MFKKLSTQELKLVSALQKKKYRDQYQLFTAESVKVVKETLPYFVLKMLIICNPDEVLSELKLPLNAPYVRYATSKEMARISTLDTAREVVAVYEMPHPRPLRCSVSKGTNLWVALDAVQNPGNLGTIIRLCDWMGVEGLLCGVGTADLYNPKVVQATAGALGSVALYPNIDLTILPQHFDTIIGTRMCDALPLASFSLPQKGANCLLLGNEGHGISSEIQALCTDHLTIPAHHTSTTESLNVGVSAAIILAQLCNNL